MSCQPIIMKDGTVVLANVKPGETLTEEDKKIIAEWVELCRERARTPRKIARSKKASKREASTR